MDIDFQHQYWSVIEDSVCAASSDDNERFSSCTYNAKALFAELCKDLTTRQSDDKVQQKYKVMYCSAATSFKPTLPRPPAYSPLKISDTEKECNVLILKTMTNFDEETLAQKNKVCGSINKK